MKKWIGILLSAALMASIFTACSGNNYGSGTQGEGGDNADPIFNTTKDIVVISREDGSGTRGAFIELLGIEQKNDDGTRKDLTTKEAIIAKQTDVMMMNIVGNPYAIGYMSLGSLNDMVKAVHIEGIPPTAENVKNGTYPITRPFNIATKGEPAGLTEDFIDFILSADGQAIVSKNYISIAENAPVYVGKNLSGKIVVAGSSSVAPIMEKLKEAYLTINPNAAIEIQMSDSSAGITGAIDGTCDIGMTSRELKDSELEKLSSTRIALDGIVIIVNNGNTVTNLTTEQVRAIFTGEALNWSVITP